MSTTPNPRYSLTEAAKLAHLSPRTLGQMIDAGDVPGASKQGTRYVIWKAHFDRFIGIADPAPVVAPKRIDFIRQRKAS